MAINILIPDDVKFILTTLEAAGYEAFIVGGCVRDALRGVTPKDWDITTSATPPQVKGLFLRTIDTGIKHGTVTALLNGLHYEVTTYRIDGEYLDSRRPETVTFAGNIEEDLSRRDFTMNAIAYNPTAGFVDPFDGRGDIEKKLIRCVGDARTRFGEDALRMLRAIRFAAALGFDVDKEALGAISALRGSLKQISAERVKEEMGKLLRAPHPESARLLGDTGLLSYVLRGREYAGDLDKIIARLQNCPAIESMRLALFLECFGLECENILRDLRFDNRTIKEVELYVRLLPAGIPTSRYEIKKFLRIMPQESFENLLKLKSIVNPAEAPAIEAVRKEAADILQKRECFTLKDLAVSGKDLAEAGIPPGEAMGDVLEGLLDDVMNNPHLNTKPELLRRVCVHSS